MSYSLPVSKWLAAIVLTRSIIDGIHLFNPAIMLQPLSISMAMKLPLLAKEAGGKQL